MEEWRDEWGCERRSCSCCVASFSVSNQVWSNDMRALAFLEKQKRKRRTVEQMLKRFNICTWRGINIVLQVVVVMKGPYTVASQRTRVSLQTMLIDPCTGFDKRWWQGQPNCRLISVVPSPDVCLIHALIPSHGYCCCVWGLECTGATQSRPGEYGGAGSGRSVVCGRLEDNWLSGIINLLQSSKHVYWLFINPRSLQGYLQPPQQLLPTEV